MDTTSNSEDTITFKRTHFYSVLVVLAFAIGILTGYVVWGAAPNGGQAAVDNPSAAQGPAAQVPAPTQSPQYTRYDIPSDGFPSIGPADAPITIAEFSDFQCPFCKRFHDETFDALMAAYPGKIRFVYRHLPLTSIHPEAFPSAEASMCANEQNAFWEFHDQIFANQNRMGRDLYIQIAGDLGLDMPAFEDCLNANEYKDLVQTDLDFALNLGVQSTPTFFINGLAIVGAQPLSAFQQIIDPELAGEIP
ncbi:MAG: DsbA family protein [Chloroflexi bacterium]|nr:DsbA family protein [Chloroflexota bacterium]